MNRDGLLTLKPDRIFSSSREGQGIKYTLQWYRSANKYDSLYLSSIEPDPPNHLDSWVVSYFEDHNLVYNNTALNSNAIIELVNKLRPLTVQL